MGFNKTEYCRAAFFYDEIMNSFNMDFSLYKDLVDILEPESILEVGCGMGRLFMLFAQKAKFITGIDLSEEMLAEGRRYFAENSPSDTVIEFSKADMCSFSTGRKYDLIVMALSVLKHLKTNEDRFRALQCAKEHLNENGFIVIDSTPFLYTSKSTDWIDAEDSMVATWLPDKQILSGYQWKKTVKGETDTLHWRFNGCGQDQFEVSFTTYPYQNYEIIDHISRLNMNYEYLLTEWGVNGIGNEGNRFIGLISKSGKKWGHKEEFLQRVNERNERLWSDHDFYLKSE
ncbi:MAG: class I SAM-dependent methyltransferase [Crocosphaera sp.]